MPFAEISLMMVGAQHPNAGKRGRPGPNRMFEILVSRPGDPVDLRAEPDNPDDDRAIANYTVGCIQIGYVAAGRTMRMRASGAQRTPVNLVANLTRPMWSQLVSDPRYRCLVPRTHFAESDGKPGLKTRTWYSVRDRPVVAWAGFCRRTPDWGSVFACMTIDSNSAVEPLNPRMPVLLEPADYDRWLHGDIRDVIDFQFRAFPSDRLQIERSDDLWVRREKKAGPQMALQL